MRFNQFSYLSLPRDTILCDLKKYGFDLPVNITNKKMFEAFLIRFFFNYKDSTYPLSNLAVDKETDLLKFFQSDKDLTADIFYTDALISNSSNHS